jgi:hypothetical protein
MGYAGIQHSRGDVKPVVVTFGILHICIVVPEACRDCRFG